jgi:alkaline phosphatase
MITQATIQKIFEKSGVMTWEDFRDLLGDEYKHTDTTEASAQPLKLEGLEEYDDDAAAATAGYTGNELYKTSTGELRIKVPEILP